MICFSTSGKSRNLVEALKTANERGLYTISIIGKGNNIMIKNSDISIIIPSTSSDRIQEIQQMIIHIISDEIERRFYDIGKK